MKNIAVIWSLIGIVLWAGMAAANPSALSPYLPTERDLPGWKMDEEPQAAEGTELFSLIDGAAETHLEYGFVRAIMQTYSNAQDELVQVEIYEMRDAAAAYGIYTFHAGDEAKPTDIGDEGVLGEYYVMFWKGAFFVMISGSESDAAQEAILTQAAQSIASKLPGDGQRPPLAEQFFHLSDAPMAVKYLKGAIGLFNLSQFDGNIINGFEEGASVEYGTFDVVLLRYASEQDAAKNFEQASRAYGANANVTNFSAQANAFSFENSEGTLVRGEQMQAFFCLISGKTAQDAAAFCQVIVALELAPK